MAVPHTRLREIIKREFSDLSLENQNKIIDILNRLYDLALCTQDKKTPSERKVKTIVNLMRSMVNVSTMEESQ